MPRRRPSPLAALLMMGWLSVVLLLDADGGRWLQRGLGLLTWVVLIVALRRVDPLIRVQTAVVVVFATVVEFVFSPTLHVYEYRFDNVPMYVPPGHGLVYLSAFALGHAGFVERRRRMWMLVVVAAGGLWAAYGLFLAERPDALGAFWYACLVLFLLFGPSRPVYLGAFAAVTHLELLGTALGTWTWGTHDPTGWVTIGNPPSGVPGGYAWFDLVALLLAPRLVAGFSRRTTGRPTVPAAEGAGAR